ncbi:MAG TPA: L28 family ribosomal protein, partial [Armatimonadota bacterium]
MANVCDVCGKGTQSGNRISHSHIRTKHTWK